MEIKSYKKKNGDTAYGFIFYIGKETEKASMQEREGLKLKRKLEQHSSNFKMI